MPAADRPLVLVSEPAEQDSRMRVREPLARDARASSATGFRFCGMVEETAARRLGHLADLGLGEQHDVAADLRGRPAGCRQRRAELRERWRFVCQGSGGSARPSSWA